MAQSILVTKNIREFSRLLYTETASSILHLFENNLLPADFDLQKVRVCCGSEQENVTKEGLQFSDNSPWLAELYFGNTPEDSINTHSIYSNYLDSKVGVMACICIQGIGKAWQARLLKHDLKTIEDLARCPTEKIKLICDQTKNVKLLEFIGKAKIAIADCPTMPLCKASEYFMFYALFLETAEVLEASPELIEINWVKVQSYLHKLIAVLDDQTLKALKISDIL